MFQSDISVYCKDIYASRGNEGTKEKEQTAGTIAQNIMQKWLMQLKSLRRIQLFDYYQIPSILSFRIMLVLEPCYSCVLCGCIVIINVAIWK